MGMFDKKGKGPAKTTRKPLKVDKMDSMKHLSPEMQQRMRDLEEQGMKKEELEETARKFLAEPIGKGGDSGESAEELARQAQEDRERQRLEEEAAAAEAKRQREIAEAKAAAEATAAQWSRNAEALKAAQKSFAVPVVAESTRDISDRIYNNANEGGFK